jgi:hypothetical protein
MKQTPVFLNAKEFLFLHDALLEKFRIENGGELPGNVRLTYGFPLHPGDPELLETMPNLKKSIENHKMVRGYMADIKGGMPAVETRYSLYQNYIDAKKENQQEPIKLKLNGHLFDIFLRYLDMTSMEEFRERLATAFPPVRYKVMFYSNLSFDVRSDCYLLVDYHTSPFDIEMRGFHLDVHNPLFKGYGMKKGYHFYINLECEERAGEEFHLICQVGSVSNPEQWSVMPASFMCISSQGTPTCGEAVVIKTGVSTVFNSEEGERRLRGMLMLKRNRFTIKSSDIRTLEGLTASGFTVTDWDYITGNYKVYGFDGFGNWHLSKLVCNPHTYDVTYHTNIFGKNSNLKHLRAEVSISNIIGKMVCLVTKSPGNKGRNIVSFVMLDFGAMQHEETASMASFVSVSTHTGRSVGGEIVVIKTKEEFEISAVADEEKAALIQKYKEAEHLNELCEEMKSRHVRIGGS